MQYVALMHAELLTSLQTRTFVSTGSESLQETPLTQQLQAAHWVPVTCVIPHKRIYSQMQALSQKFATEATLFTRFPGVSK